MHSSVIFQICILNHQDFEAFTQSSLEDVLDKPYPFYFIGFPSAKDPSWDGRYPGNKSFHS